MAEKKKSFSLRKLIYNDKYLIIISVLAAIVIWVAISMNLSPETTKTISVPLTVDFSGSAAEQLGIKCYGDKTINVDVTVSCKKYLAKDITADDIKVSLQTNVVSSKGNFEVPIKVDTSDDADFKVTSYYPTIYKAYFDVEDKKTMDIDLKYSSNDYIADGYTKGEPLLSQSTVTVKGPSDYVSQVTQVLANVNIDGKLSKTTTMELVANALDSNGSKVNYITLDTGSENLTITIPVLKKTQLDVTTSFTGKPSSVNTDDFDISYSVNKVNCGVLEDAGIKQANIGTIDFSQLKVGTNTFKFNVEALDSIVILDNIKEITVTVTVPTSYESKTFSISDSNLKVVNVPDGYTAKVTGYDFDDVTVIGKKSSLDKLNSSNINLVVDLSGIDDNIKEGVALYKLNSAFENSDVCWINGTYSAYVSLAKE